MTAASDGPSIPGRSTPPVPLVRLALLLAVSGAVGLSYELVWMRRLGLILGGSAVASSVVAGAYLGGLGLGAALSPRLRGHPARLYGGLELVAAAWAVLFPALLGLGQAAVVAWPASRWAVAVALLAPPATALGATWPVLVRTTGAVGAGTLYAANTVGAVLGVVLSAFVVMPAVGIRATELAAAAAGLAVAWAAGSGRVLPVDTTPASGPALAAGPTDAPEDPPTPQAPTASSGRGVPAVLLGAVSVSGLAAMALEGVWFRLAAVAFGGTVQNQGLVLATFLAMVALGAAWGRRWPARPLDGVAGGLVALGALAVVGALSWAQLPWALAAAFRVGGAEVLMPVTGLLAVLGMGGAPVASGLVFTAAIRALAEEGEDGAALGDRAGALYAANTFAGIVGVWLAALWAVPVLELRGTVQAVAGLSGATGVVLWGRGRGLGWRTGLAAVGVAGVVLAAPRWDARLYAVGLHLRISDFADPSTEALRAFVDEGWELVQYDHGRLATVAVGRSTRSDNLWLSIDGKVDASTGDDMPTQELSATLPLGLVPGDGPLDVAVVGLASGVTAGRVLDDPRVRSLTVIELEPAVVEASRLFDAVSGAPLDDPRTTLVVDDARGFLQRTDRTFDVIVSEPSNPWISGVSNLFTREYWALARSRLSADGVMCQWIQLYGLGPEQLSALVRTYTDVFPQTYLFETIPGADALMIGGAPVLREGLGRPVRLDPAGMRRLGGVGWRNTDDHPRVEWEAPGWLHFSSAPRNAARIEAAAEP